VLLGAGVFLWVFWTLATIPGYLAGALVTDPRRYALDVLMPIFFAAMLVPLWKGARLALPWGIAGVVALAVQALLPGYVFIIAGALAGMLAGALIDDG
jgi:predicted branched-subunit amino acid permease